MRVGNVSAKLCRPIDLDDHADISTTDVVYNTEVNVSCLTGYEMSPDVTSITTVCTQNATWSDDVPLCQRKFGIIMLNGQVQQHSRQ